MAADATLSSLTGTLVIQNANIAILAKALQQEKATGQAVLKMIDGSAALPAKGASEPGKGALIDLLA